MVEGGGGQDTEQHGRSVAPLDQSTAQPRIDLGVVVAPGLARDVTAGIAENLLEDLRAQYDGVDWRAELRVDRLVMPPVPTTHGIAVVSLPALGPLHLRQRLRRAVLELVGELVGHGVGGRNLLRELSTEVPNRPGLAFVPAVLLSHVRLLLGMVRANRRGVSLPACTEPSSLRSLSVSTASSPLTSGAFRAR